MIPDGYVTVQEAARVLGLYETRIGPLVKKGYLTAIRVPWGANGHRVYICRDSLHLEQERRATGILIGRWVLLPQGVEERRPLWFL